jgi:excisionase family DNA binding protein
MAVNSSINPLATPENFPPAVLTKQEAADFIGCTTRYLERQVRAGRLKACKPTAKFWRVRLCDLEAFLESGATTNGGG